MRDFFNWVRDGICQTAEVVHQSLGIISTAFLVVSSVCLSATALPPVRRVPLLGPGLWLVGQVTGMLGCLSGAAYLGSEGQRILDQRAVDALEGANRRLQVRIDNVEAENQGLQAQAAINLARAAANDRVLAERGQRLAALEAPQPVAQEDPHLNHRRPGR